MIRLTLVLALFLTLFFTSFSWSQTIAPPVRVVCQTASSLNTKILQLRTDSGTAHTPILLLALDPQGKPFKEIVSTQAVYSDENLSITFLAAVDSQGRFGVFKYEVKTAVKVGTSQFINSLPPALKSFANYSRDFDFSLFSFYKGNLLYPANESGKWRLLALSTGTVLKEWTHPVMLFNPVLRDQMVTWTTATSDGSHLYTYNLKTDARDVVAYKNTIQVISVNKEEVILVNYFNFDAKKRVIRIQNYINGSTRVLYELDNSTALYNNFVAVGSNLIFTSEKTFVSNNQIQVAEAYLNVYDLNKNMIAQRIKYPQVLLDIMRKQSPLTIRLLHSPMFNLNEILFSLNEMSGIVKYQFKTANWFYINYPISESTCFNPSFVTLIAR